MLRFFVVLTALIAMVSSCQNKEQNNIITIKDGVKITIDTVNNSIVQMEINSYQIFQIPHNGEVFMQHGIELSEAFNSTFEENICQGTGHPTAMKMRDAVSPCNNEQWLIKNGIYSIFGVDITGYLSP